MFFDLDLRGDALPSKTLCLTYDDGPGPKTAELGDYLAERGIAATFFVIGTQVRANPGIIPQLRAGGHLIANHTETHPHLVAFVRDGGDVVGELARADEAIGAPSASGELTFFRPPYGDWREDLVPNEPEAEFDNDPEGTTSATARLLNADGRFPHLVGPVGWDIDGRDWDYWKSRATAEECGQTYLAAIEAQGRGIVLMHDGSDIPEVRAGNRAEEMTRWLVPRLEERGYRFVRLDRVPGVESASRVTRQVMFGYGLGQWLTCPGDSTRLKLTTSHRRPGARERFGVVPVGTAKRGELVGLRAWNGRYLTRTKSGHVAAEALSIDDSSRWQFAPDATGRVEIRSSRHESIAIDDHPCEVRLRANISWPLRFQVKLVAEVAPL